MIPSLLSAMSFDDKIMTILISTLVLCDISLDGKSGVRRVFTCTCMYMYICICAIYIQIVASLHVLACICICVYVLYIYKMISAYFYFSTYQK